MSKYRKFAIRGIVAGAAIALMAIVGTVAGKNTNFYADTLPRDCDATSVIDCGATSIAELEKEYAAGGTKIHYNDLTQIYAAFGISDSAIKGLGTGATQWAWGQVRADGTIWMNGQQIGSGALTAGRRITAHSIAIPGTGAYIRPPSDSFAHPSTVIDMFIGFENGKPAWGIITSCGNPVKWPISHTTITKQVGSPAGSWVKDATFTNGNQISYLLTVKNDGAATDTNVRVIDKLPANQTYITGSTKVNNVVVPGTDGITSTGFNIATLAPGQIAYITYSVKLSVPATTCGVTDMQNIAREDSDKSGTTEDDATTHTNVVCQTVKCDSLMGPDAIKVGDTATFTANASDASLVSAYTFTINGTKLNSTGNTTSLKMTNAGTFKIAATITPKTGVTDGGSAACVKNVVVSTNPVTKTVKCDSLAGPDTVMVGDTATFTANASDASLVSAYTFTINGTKINSTGNSTSVKMTNAGTYTIAAVITPIAGVTDGGSAACVKTVTVAPVVQTVKCDSLTGPDTIVLGQAANYKANASDANLVASYAFTVNGKSVSADANELNLNLTNPGTYTIAAKITPKAGVTDGGSAACVKTLKVTQPVYSCDLLTVTPSTLKVGGTVTANATYTASNGAVFKSASFNFGEGAPVVTTNPTTVTAQHVYNTAGTKNITVEISFTVPGGTVTSTSTNCQKQVTVTDIPQIVTNCDALDASPSNITLGQTSVLKAHATALNTSVTGYKFSVDGQTVQNSASDTYSYTPTTAGNHNVAVTVTFANGDVKGGNGTCAKTICVTEVTTPVYTCDLLSLSATTIKDGDKVTATVKYTATNGATFTKAVVNFGEASVNVPTASNGSFTADYTYKTAKDYNVTATITFTVNGQTYDVTSSACGAKVSTTPVVMCKVPGKEQYPANDSRCNDVKGVTTLPNTGAGNMIGLFAAVTAAGAVLHNVWMRKFQR